ncbi:unannotated protein [freshwater metagenome]|uniref:Unannotated protein n=1 Tax=freshwater metagenome TaxID=449393 RepID=A0A6J7IVS3_9ZZZZ
MTCAAVRGEIVPNFKSAESSEVPWMLGVLRSSP